MKPTLFFLPLAALALSQPCRLEAEDAVLFACDFSKLLAPEWRMVGGRWEVKDGCLQQTDPRPPDPTKAILVVGDREEISDEVVITARLRLDSWKEGDWARAGISVCSDPVTARGYSLVFHQGRLEFVHDYVSWGPGAKFSCQTGVWYRMKLARQAGELKGKAWLETDPEPAAWLVTWKHGGEEVTGYPALVGGSGGPNEDVCTVSFAGCQVFQDASRLQVRKIERALARWNEASLQSVRLAVEDLSSHYGPRYPRGGEYLRRLAALEKTISEARSSVGPMTSPERFLAGVRQFEALRAEALLANPLLDFDRLLVVKRKDARAYNPVPRFPIPPLCNGPGHLLNGLPINYQGNGVLRQVPIDNEIAVLSPAAPGRPSDDRAPPQQAGFRRRPEAALRRRPAALLLHRQPRPVADLRDRRRRPRPPPGDARARRTTSTTTTPATCPTTGSCSPRPPVSSRCRASGGATRWPTSA